MATANTTTTRTGTGWTVDVTLTNLDPDTSLKDFIVLENAVAGNLANYTKTTRTILTYGGASLPSNTPIEVRRATPTSPVQVLTNFPAKLSSALWNKEMDRITRRAEEYAVNGVGAGAVVTIALPLDGAYPTGWNGDVTYPPTRNAVYDIVSTLAPIADPVFTGDPEAPTPLTADNDTSIATTQFVKNVLAGSPVFVNPTCNTPAAGDKSTKIATTEFVNSKAVVNLNWYSAVVWVVGNLYRIKLDTATNLTVLSDNASCWSADHFTAPAAGVYLFMGHHTFAATGMSGSSYLNWEFWYQKNGGSLVQASYGNSYQGYYLNSHETDCFQFTLSLAANDTIKLYSVDSAQDGGNPTGQSHTGEMTIIQL